MCVTAFMNNASSLSEEVSSVSTLYSFFLCQLLLAVGRVDLNDWLVQWKSPKYTKSEIVVN